MAAYVFETMTQEQAAQFAAADILVFQTGSSNSVTVRETSSTGLGGAALQGVEITSAGRSLTFPAGNLSEASVANRVQFGDNSRLLIGTNGADSASFQGSQAGDAIYAFSGADSIGGDLGADLLNGGLGADVINGGDNNDRIFGNDVQNNQPGGTQDGADTIDGGAGGDVIQGNQGSDSIDGGADSDRIQGGAGNDFLRGGAAEIDGGGLTVNNGSDSINGNTGNDTILGDGGDDFLRGGQNDDSLGGGNNNDVLMGDAGNDSLDGGAGLDILMGGTGTNNYFFDEGDSAFTTQGGSFANITDQISDFQLNNDGFFIEATVGTGGELESAFENVEKDNGATFTSLDFARTYAQGLLQETGVDAADSVAAVQVGSDTYIFWDGDANGTVDSAVRLVGINVTDVTAQSLFGNN